MTRFTVDDTPIEGAKVITRTVLRDERGYFARLFCADELAGAGWNGPIAQINESWTASKGSLRGMHYQQPPYSEAKLVTCVRGAVLDVALDIRTGSRSLLRWHSEVLSADNGRAFLIPEGCAHGFQTLTDDVILIYCHSGAYVPDADRGVNPFDPQAAIEWPLEIADISEKDRERPMLAADFVGVEL